MSQQISGGGVESSAFESEDRLAALNDIPPLVIAHAPSPITRDLHDLEAELQNGRFRHEAVTSLCDRLLHNLLRHFESEDLTTVLPDLERAEPSSRVEAEQCVCQRQETIAQAAQLARRSREERRDLHWQRQISREFISLRTTLNVQQRRELELIRNTYRLDVAESD